MTEGACNEYGTLKAAKPIIGVCAAVIIHDGAFLLGVRPAGKHLAGYWEFPGGKARAGETLEACVKREVKEELGVSVKHVHHLHSLDHHYPEKCVRLHFMECEREAGSQPLALEHDAIRWVTLKEAETMSLAPADRRFLKIWENGEIKKR